MQTSKIELKKANAQPSRFVQQIGSTIFNVNVSFNETVKETPKDRILRLILRELDREKNILQNRFNYGTMALPQVDWLLERGAV